MNFRIKLMAIWRIMKADAFIVTTQKKNKATSCFLKCTPQLLDIGHGATSGHIQFQERKKRAEQEIETQIKKALEL